MEISDRLKAKIEERGWSTRRFQQEVEASAPEGSRGTSYASVYAYVDGKGKPPPLDFIETAAHVLNIRPAWLAFGDGPETPEGAGRSGRDLFQPEAAGGPVRSAASLIPMLTHGAGEDLLVRLVHELVNAHPTDAGELTDDDLATAVEVIESCVFGIVNALRGTGGRSARAGMLPVLNLLTGMLAAVPEPRGGRPLHEVLELLPQPTDIISRSGGR